MPEKLTLTSYLVKRGKGNALTRIEAQAFGIDYPLVAGWPGRHGEMEITAAMLEQLEQGIAAASGGVAKRARRGLDAVDGVAPAPVTRPVRKVAAVRAAPTVPVAPAARASPVKGFVLRRPKSYRARKQAPWA